MKYNFKDYVRTLELTKRNDYINVDFSDFSNFVCFGSALMRVNEAYLNIVNYYPDFAITGTTPQSLSSVAISGAAFEQLIDFYNKADAYTIYLFNEIFNGLTAYSITSLNIVNVGYNNTLSGNLSGTYYSVPIVYRDSNRELLSATQQSAFTNLALSAEYYDRDNTFALHKRFGEYFIYDERNEDFQRLIYIIGRFFDEQRLLVLQQSKLYNPDWLEHNYPNYKQLLLLQENFNINLDEMITRPHLDEFVCGSSRQSVTNLFLNKKILHRIISNYAWIYKSKGNYESIFPVCKLFGVDVDVVDIAETVYGKIRTFSLWEDFIGSLTGGGEIVEEPYLYIIPSSLDFGTFGI